MEIKEASSIYPCSPSLPPSFPLIPGEEAKGKIRNFNETIELQVGSEGWREGGR